MMTGWRDLRDTCSVCGKRADFAVVRTNDDLPAGYIRSGTRETGYCLAHLPEEVHRDKASMLSAVQQPFAV